MTTVAHSRHIVRLFPNAYFLWALYFHFLLFTFIQMIIIVPQIFPINDSKSLASALMLDYDDSLYKIWKLDDTKLATN